MRERVSEGGSEGGREEGWRDGGREGDARASTQAGNTSVPVLTVAPRRSVKHRLHAQHSGDGEGLLQASTLHAGDEEAR